MLPTSATASTTKLKATGTATSSLGAAAVMANSPLKNLQSTKKSAPTFNLANVLSSFTQNISGSTTGSAISALGRTTALIGSFSANPISIIPAGVTALTSVTGSFAQATQAINEYRQQFQSNVWAGATGSGEKLSNPLRTNNHYNYIITLGILTTPQNNYPASYKDRGFDKIILKSGGGEYDKRQRIYSEAGEDAEYFIENLDIDSVISPNPLTGVALGTALSFDVIEPFSMGHFTEALVMAARETNHTAFMDAPYCLKIEFVGWDSYGSSIGSYVAQPYYIPIKIIDIGFSVSSTGSIYNVKAVPHSEIALSDEINLIHTDVKTSGREIHEVLENSVQSVTNIMNARNAKQETAKLISKFDRYLIVFPKTPTAIADILKANISDVKPVNAAEEIAIMKGMAAPVAELNNPKIRTALQNIAASNITLEIYSILKTYAQDKNQMNDIGRSKFLDEIAQGGTQSSNLSTVFEDKTMIFRRMTPEGQSAAFSREFSYSQSTKLTDIIDNVLLSSKYTKDEATKADSTEQRRWYRIETYTFTENNAKVESQIGRSPRVYVYAIHPFIADQYHSLSPSGTPTTTEQLKKAAVKEYNYFYTGKNEDVLDFDIRYNYSFLQSAFSDFGQLTATEQTKGQSDAVARSASSPIIPTLPGTTSSNIPTAPIKQSTTNYSNTTGGSISTQDSARQAAVTFHDRLINSQADMITAEMKIWGDPYYLPSVLGNYSPAASSGSNMLTADGTMNYLRNEIMIVINFLSPLDYSVGGAMMTFPTVNPMFSGVYQVITVNNSLDRGQFLQTLTLVRQRGQENTATSTANMYISAGSSGSLSKTKPQPQRSGPRPPPGISNNPAAVITSTGSVIDSRVGIWANTAAVTASNLGTSLVNPITSLSSLGSMLTSAPTALTSAISAGTKAINSTLNAIKPSVDSGRR